MRRDFQDSFTEYERNSKCKVIKHNPGQVAEVISLINKLQRHNIKWEANEDAKFEELHENGFKVECIEQGQQKIMQLRKLQSEKPIAKVICENGATHGSEAVKIYREGLIKSYLKNGKAVQLEEL